VDASLDRAVASVLGLAIGDALGAGTDATAMARNLWLSLIANGAELDSHDVLARHLILLDAGHPRLDNVTRRVLARAGEGVADAARDYVELRGPEVSAGNGSVMYCAPLGIAYAHAPDRLYELAPALSAITYWDGRCRTACLAVTLAVAASVRGEGPEPAVRAAVAAVADLEGGEELEYLVGEAGRTRPVNGPDMSFCLFTAGLALQVAGERRDFEEGLHHVVGLGGDTGRNAAVAGALLGAAHGTDALPPAWLAVLAERDRITEEANALAALVERGPASQ
jgi:ADP-ribosyl-[dinitrogen reductase] hydrolase